MSRRRRLQNIVVVAVILSLVAMYGLLYWQLHSANFQHHERSHHSMHVPRPRLHLRENLALHRELHRKEQQLVKHIELGLKQQRNSSQVVVESLSKESGSSVAVTREHKYQSDVTLYIEKSDGERIPSGWSTRVEDGVAKEQPFEFQPGVNLIQGWTIGVLQMEEGERALLHVPAALGYDSSPMGRKGGAFYIPANSNLLFDIKILGKA